MSSGSWMSRWWSAEDFFINTLLTNINSTHCVTGAAAEADLPNVLTARYDGDIKCKNVSPVKCVCGFVVSC